MPDANNDTRARRQQQRALETRSALLDTAIQDRQWVTPDDTATLIRIAVAGPRLPLGDIAHHRAGVAADLLGPSHAL